MPLADHPQQAPAYEAPAQPQRTTFWHPHGCLSQWWPSPFSLDGETFATAEHYMMWRKATLFGDAPTAERILTASHPRAAKTLGAQVAGFDQQVWDAHRYDIVVDGNLAKFDQRPELCAFLLGTGDRVLVEASPIDRIWGIGLAADDPRVGDPTRWRGLNLLGFELMDVSYVRAALPRAWGTTQPPPQGRYPILDYRAPTR